MFTPGLAIFNLATIPRLNHVCSVGVGFFIIEFVSDLSTFTRADSPLDARAEYRRGSLFYSKVISYEDIVETQAKA
jgi:hypothetical protein